MLPSAKPAPPRELGGGAAKGERWAGTGSRWTSAARSPTSSRTTRSAGTYAAGKASDDAARPDRGRASPALDAGRRRRPPTIGFTVHGTTVGLNAFLQRRGERVLLLATAGRRRRLPDRARQPDTPVRPALPQADAARAAGGHRRDPRAGSTGAARSSTPLDEDAVRAAARARARRGLRRRRRRASSSAILNPAHELRGRARSCARSSTRSTSRSRTGSRASGASTSAPRRRSSTPTPRRSSAATSSASRSEMRERRASRSRCT